MRCYGGAGGVGHAFVIGVVRVPIGVDQVLDRIGIHRRQCIGNCRPGDRKAGTTRSLPSLPVRTAICRRAFKDADIARIGWTLILAFAAA